MKIPIAHLFVVACSTILFSCDFYEDDEPGCVPGMRPAGCFLGSCWSEYYDDCSGSSNEQIKGSMYAVFENKYPLSTSDWDKISVGDTVLVTLVYADFYSPTSTYDSLIFEMCDGIIKKRFTKNELLQGVGNTTYSGSWRGEFIMDEEGLPGSYQYSMKAWRKGEVFYENSKELFIYPEFEVPVNCVEDNRVTVLVYVPINTPEDSKIQIKQIGLDWPFETETSFFLNKIDPFRYCITMDFREYEKWIFLREGDETKCGKYFVSSDCAEYAYYEKDNLYIITIGAWNDDDDLENPSPVCLLN
jgi:hypothetical protein